jgi:hypothetical protein
MPAIVKMHCRTRAIHTLAVVLTLAAGASFGFAPLACGDGPPHWNVSQASLIRKLEGGFAPSQPIDGGSVARQCRWRPKEQVLQIDGLASGQAKTATVVDLAFRLRLPQEEPSFTPLTYKNDIWYGSTYWTGPNWTRVGKDWHHPGETTPSVRCWRAPRDGRVTVRGAVYKLHLEGNGVRASIFHRGREVWRAEIDGQDNRGVDPQLTRNVRQGDALRFVIHPRGGIACDTTHWDPTITYEAGETFQASKGFGDKQGNGGWFYEMQDSVTTAPPVTPVVHTLGLDMSLRETTAA